ncbi:MAG: hypothetical protein ACTHMC_19685, partial [Pseudobacter sp.]|uniref:hypothetical protein n=1 Tax=Pseudobacter sp. TaxID=2045420 RepID=UPI003F81B085
MKQLTGLLSLLLLSVMGFARQGGKNDVVLKITGDELTGKVQAINDSAIVFSYAGESLTYSIKKAEILKITYASGRIEVFNRPTAPPAAGGASQKTAAGNMEAHHNKVAFLPFTFVKD